MMRDAKQSEADCIKNNFEFILSYFHDHAQFVIPSLLAGHRSYKYHAFQDKNIFFFFQDLFVIVLSGSQDSVRFSRPVARQNGGNYTLRMILKVAYCQQVSVLVNKIRSESNMKKDWKIELLKNQREEDNFQEQVGKHSP